MLGLGADISHAVTPSVLVPLVINSALFTFDNNDESLQIVIQYTDSATQNAIADGQGISQFARLNFN